MKHIGALLLFSGALLAQPSGKFGVFEGAGDVGSPSRAGSVVFEAAKNEYRATGGGENMWGQKDAFFFVWRKVTGDVTLTADVKLDAAGAPHRKAGLIVRKGLEAGAPYADILVHGDGHPGLQFRDKPDDSTRAVSFPVKTPARVRIERKGAAITISLAAKPGDPLVEAGSTNINLGAPVWVGLAVCAHDDKAEPMTAVFSNVKLEIP